MLDVVHVGKESCRSIEKMHTLGQCSPETHLKINVGQQRGPGGRGGCKASARADHGQPGQKGPGQLRQGFTDLHRWSSWRPHTHTLSFLQVGVCTQPGCFLCFRVSQGCNPAVSWGCSLIRGSAEGKSASKLSQSVGRIYFLAIARLQVSVSFWSLTLAPRDGSWLLARWASPAWPFIFMAACSFKVRNRQS